MDINNPIVHLKSGGYLVINQTEALVAIDINSSTLDIDASDNVTIDASGGSISVGTNSSGRAITIGHTTSEVTIGDNLTVNGNATITGDLDVNGTLTTIDTTNLSIKDQLIFAASGSHSSNVDAGLSSDRCFVLYIQKNCLKSFCFRTR